MIKKDKSVYLDYITDIGKKVNALCAKVAPGAVSKDIEKLRVKIAAKTTLLTQKANSDKLIPNADWVNFKQEIDSLYQELADKVNRCAACAPQMNNSIVR
ncbi:MAG: hypothetical protein ACLRFJ_03600 [Alphaproteobacteria bacterium]